MNNSLVKKRLKRAKGFGKIIVFLPFVRCVILNGSLAKGRAKESSDIDLLIIAKNGRIFSARFFVNVFGILLGIKRSKNTSKNHNGKFCFNYFMTESFLTIPIGRGKAMDKYCADNYSTSLFIAGNMGLYKKYINTNQNLFKKYGFKTPVINAELVNQRPIVRNFLERILGDRFESWVKTFQINKIESDPITKNYPTLVVYNDNEMRFHPPKN